MIYQQVRILGVDFSRLYLQVIISKVCVKIMSLLSAKTDL